MFLKKKKISKKKKGINYSKILPILFPTFVQSAYDDLAKRVDGLRLFLILSSVHSLHKRCV